MSLSGSISEHTDTKPWLVAVVYTIAGLAVYGIILNAFLISDDFYFLDIVAPASSVLVSYEPLVGRFVRPLVVALYYVSYHAAGLSPWLYHVLTLLPHLLTAWFLYLITARIAGRGERLWAFLAGLLFVVFAGHSEAVAWPAGAADPLLAAALMAALFCYVRALEPGSSARWLAGFFAALVLATQAKEAWAMFPGILIAHAVAFGFQDRTARRRAVVAIGGAIALVLTYLVMRRLVFGSVTGGFGGLASSFGGDFLAWAGQMRAFLLRCFLPSGSIAARAWLSGGDVLIWPVAIVLVALTARGAALRMIVFSALAMFAALTPVLPFTISVSTTESERFVYLATIFSCILFVWGMRTVLKARPLAIAACVVVIGLHASALVRNNLKWKEAGRLTHSIIETLADQMLGHDAQGRAAIFVLNLADNIGGPFVFRTGFYPALQLGRPEIAARTPGVVVVATHSLETWQDDARVTRTGPRTFLSDLGSNRIVRPPIPSAPFLYEISDQTATSYRIAFSDSIDKAVVLYMSGGRIEFAGAVEGLGLPFGVVDIPPGDAVCDGASMRFAGWALDGDGVRRVKIESAPEGGVLGDGIARPGMRPDVAARYPAFPDAARAGWDFELPCETVRRTSGETLKVRVVVEDTGGLTRVIADRVIRTAGSAPAVEAARGPGVEDRVVALK